MDELLGRIARAHDGHVRLHALLPAGSRVDVAIAGELAVDDETRARAASIRARLASSEPQAVVESIEATRLVVARADYATVRALRAQGRLPRVLSAGAIAVDGRRLLVHRRALATENYPGRLHTLGGAFRTDDATVEAAMRREVAEESGARVTDGAWPLLVAEEPPTGYVQCVFLGVTLAGVAPFTSAEGDLVPVEMDRLPALLCDRAAWVPSGRAAVLAFLATGAGGLAVDGRAVVEHVLAHGRGAFPLPASA